MKKVAMLVFLSIFFLACGGGEPKPSIDDFKAKDDGKGIGPAKSVTLNTPLVAGMVDKGKGIYEMKCAACHKLTEQRVVGPGWKGLTERRKPEWIMNMTTNVEEMLEKDDAAKAMLKECLVRMPNQNLTSDDARDVLEFMYSIDGKEVGQ